MKKIFLLCSFITLLFVFFSYGEIINASTTITVDDNSFTYEVETTGTTATVDIEINDHVNHVSYIKIFEPNNPDEIKFSQGLGYSKYTLKIENLDYETNYNDYKIVVGWTDDVDTHTIEKKFGFETQKFDIDELNIELGGLNTTWQFSYDYEKDSVNDFIDEVITAIEDNVNNAYINIWDTTNNDTLSKNGTEIADKTVLESTLNSIKAEILNVGDDNWSENTRVELNNLVIKLEFDYAGQTITEVKTLSVIINGYKTPSMFHPQYILDLVFALLAPGVGLDSNVVHDEFDSTLRGITGEIMVLVELSNI